jgi:hypothetical protein
VVHVIVVGVALAARVQCAGEEMEAMLARLLCCGRSLAVAACRTISGSLPRSPEMRACFIYSACARIWLIWKSLSKR